MSSPPKCIRNIAKASATLTDESAISCTSAPKCSINSGKENAPRDCFSKRARNDLTLFSNVMLDISADLIWWVWGGGGGGSEMWVVIDLF